MVKFEEIEGATYGIRINDSILSKLIRNLPIINLLYTKKVELCVVRRTDQGGPIEGIFHYTRLPRWWMKEVPLRFALPEHCKNILVYIEDCSSKHKRIAEQASKDRDIYAHIWDTNTRLIRADL